MCSVHCAWPSPPGTELCCCCSGGAVAHAPAASESAGESGGWLPCAAAPSRTGSAGRGAGSCAGAAASGGCGRMMAGRGGTPAKKNKRRVRPCRPYGSLAAGCSEGAPAMGMPGTNGPGFRPKTGGRMCGCTTSGMCSMREVEQITRGSEVRDAQMQPQSAFETGAGKVPEHGVDIARAHRHWRIHRLRNHVRWHRCTMHMPSNTYARDRFGLVAVHARGQASHGPPGMPRGIMCGCIICMPAS
jgi:hypothetical protein